MIKAGQAGKASDFVISVLAGEALSARDACYIDASDGKAYKCDADDETKVAFAGFAQEAAILNGPVLLVPSGLLSGFTSMTPNAVYFLSGTAGAITTTAPAIAVPVGKAVTATTLKVGDLERVVSRRFEASGTWRKKDGLLYVIVEAWGGGGSGSRSASGNAPGGAGGAYIRRRILASELGSTETVTIGAGGAARTTDSGGQDGGNSTFGSHLTAYGGAGGVGFAGGLSRGGGGGGVFSAPASGVGGIGGASSPAASITTPLYPLYGDGGGHGATVDGATAGAAGASIYGGAGGGGVGSGGATSVGGVSIYGGDGSDGANGSNANPGQTPGGGGGGCRGANSGAGGGGLILVTEFYS